ncbi:MAG: SMC-Scp complex subunit ScpB [Planctomycetes bacterium]|nr:SMC-Scp complex subunit ScpB [Planctomycetota bacterium]
MLAWQRSCWTPPLGRIISPMPPSEPEQEKESAAPQGGDDSAQGRFSLHRLSAAFAKLTGTSEPKPEPSEVADSLGESTAATTIGEVVSPRMIIEGMLFVGDSEGRPLTNRQLAANIRDVSPKEVDELVGELNQSYRRSRASYEVVSEGAGYRMQIRPEMDSIRHRFHGKVREARLTPTAIEVLSVVAYRQPITGEEVGKLRSSKSSGILAQLVRRGLLRIERAADSPRKPTYHTTERFNGLFQVASAADLPKSEDLDDS